MTCVWINLRTQQYLFRTKLFKRDEKYRNPKDKDMSMIFYSGFKMTHCPNIYVRIQQIIGVYNEWPDTCQNYDLSESKEYHM